MDASPLRLLSTGGLLKCKDEVIEHSLQLMQNLQKQYENGTLCDVGLKLADDLIVMAHRNVLSASCPFFCAMFTGGLLESKAEVIDLRNVGASPGTIQLLIHFIYSGSNKINSENAEDILQAADRFGLVTCAAHSLKEILTSKTALLADVFSCVDLRYSAENFILQNFSTVSIADEFLQMPVEFLLRFLHSNELFVKPEVEVLNLALKWILTDVCVRRQYINDVLDAVRITLIPASMLEHLSASCTDPSIQAVLQTMPQNLQHVSVKCARPRLQSGRRIYLVGGGSMIRDDADHQLNLLSDVDCYDTLLGVWTTATPRLCDRACASFTTSVAALGGLIYVVGEYSSSIDFDPAQNVSSVNCFDPLHPTNPWTTVAAMKYPRVDAGICTIDNSLLVFGGWHDRSGWHERGDSAFAVEMYDALNNTWSVFDEMRAEVRISFGLAEHEGNLGGEKTVRESFCDLRSVDRYNPVTKQWLSLASMIHKRLLFNLVALDDALYAICGFNGMEGTIASAERYSIEEDVWVEVCPMLTSRSAFAAAAVNGLIYVFGGEIFGYDDPASNHEVTTFEIFDAKRDKWTVGGSIPRGRSHAGVAVL